MNFVELLLLFWWRKLCEYTGSFCDFVIFGYEILGYNLRGRVCFFG